MTVGDGAGGRGPGSLPPAARCIFLQLTDIGPGEARRPADGRISVSRNSAPIPDVDKSVSQSVV